MLDTNTVSYLMRNHPQVIKRVIAKPMASLCISVITESELLFGIAKRPGAKRLHVMVREFLKRVEIFPWDSTLSEGYGHLRAKMEHEGKNLAPFDLLIAAHALTKKITLVTNDQAFKQVPGLNLEDWTL
ncbi:MAG TPA: type II toxin-antitoxin system VapC family toxin [Gammaproteobacteria bacterium]|nr:type II toxin-antitoxin system VapC family toxin [Gammaproteobacteria bacterium]